MENINKLAGMRLTFKFFVIGVCVALLILSAKCSILLESVTPVPFTLHIFCILLSGLLLGSLYGTLAVLIYLLLGAIGLPVFFHGQTGLSVFSGATGGYLLAFVPCVISVGLLKQLPASQYSFRTLFMKCINSCFVVLMLGCVVLMNSNQLTLRETLIYGFVPFIPGVILQSFGAVACYRYLNRKRIFHW